MIDVAEEAPPTAQGATSPRASSPEAKWSDHKGKVTLYSENVLQEPQSTEVVDRESIANLATTRRQWETIFDTKEETQNQTKVKKNPPKWQVRLPYTEKTAPGPDTVTASKSPEPDSPPPVSNSKPSSMADSDTESAIEREIRLAVEREEMVKKEQEERIRQQSRQSLKASSMESSTESELQPTFHELTEADRGSEFLINERVVQQEDAEQEESLQRGFGHQKFNRANKSNSEGGTESIIEREIRLQREREAELAQQRGGGGGGRPTQTTPTVVSQPPVMRERSPSPEPEQEIDIVQEIPYEEAISSYNHEGESRIAKELRELREREEEVRRLREQMNKASVSVGSKEPEQEKKPATPTQSKQPQKPVSTPHTPRGLGSVPSTPRGIASVPSTPRDKTPSVNTSITRNVHASPHLDTPTTPSTDTPPPKQETPIEREIRLARERENELRRAKGMPELPPEPKKQQSIDQTDGEETLGTPRYYAPQPDTSMRRFASNRLQQEILDQRNREMRLRQEGKIISTSEEHIQPLKYTEVVGEDRVEGGTVKRNFKTPGRRSSAASSEDLNGDSQVSSPAPQTPREGAPGKKGPKSAAVSFSYREFAQTAESKIERELREMREREEELRKQRTGEATES